ncbi:MAG: YbaN family protein [Bacteroidales bacterium]|nr:YbaN family protein [Bacteroidales bacterium]MDD3891376.1 YbaN family protein [Bacteroidales bacterium]
MSLKHNKPTSPFLKALFVIVGLISLGLGIIGIVLPVLPTTPFFLLSAYLFLRSSQRLYRWLLTHKLFGNYIKNYIYHKAIGKGVKIFTLVLLWSTILLSIYLVREKIWLQIFLAIVAVAVSIHVLRLRTMTKELNHSEIGEGKIENKNENHPKVE